MPDFLLCNSKLTFQMTMVPDKTNYITQGPDGVKRLKQGPDLGSYRGLSIIHSRAFAMEAGQHPRDILRRRVRTAEYYRIPPNPDNVHCTFELYNEERDTWSSMTFKDLLRFALNSPSDGEASENSIALRQAFEEAMTLEKEHKDARSASRRLEASGFLGSGLSDDVIEEQRKIINQNVTKEFNTQLEFIDLDTASNLLYAAIRYYEMRQIRMQLPCAMNMGLSIHAAKNSQYGIAMKLGQKTGMNLDQIIEIPRCSHAKMLELYNKLKYKQLFVPFVFDINDEVLAEPGTAAWFEAFTFYLTVFRRGGMFLDDFEFDLQTNDQNALVISKQAFTSLSEGRYKGPINTRNDKVDRSCFILQNIPITGNVNHELHMNPFAGSTVTERCSRKLAEDMQTTFEDTRRSAGDLLGSGILISWELLNELMQPVRLQNESVTFIEAAYRNRLQIGDKLFLSVDVLNAWLQIKKVMEKDNREKPRSNACDITVKTHQYIIEILSTIRSQLKEKNVIQEVKSPRGLPERLAEYGIDTWPMGITSLSRHGNPLNSSVDGKIFQRYRKCLTSTFGHLNLEYLRQASEYPGLSMWQSFAKFETIAGDLFDAWLDFENDPPSILQASLNLIECLYKRIFELPAGYKSLYKHTVLTKGGDIQDEYQRALRVGMEICYNVSEPDACLANYRDTQADANTRPRMSANRSIGPNVSDVSLVLGEDFRSDLQPDEVVMREARRSRLGDVEIVIVRPNIEHHMLGIIMGQGGSELGNTLWGQTELSVYDDSMHGIWGMSYKYHERAIVFNEKNLVRLWDIAYDGYNGGKDDTHVHWDEDDERNPHGYKAFQKHSVDTNHNYRGPSMMVMAFVHDQHSDTFENNFKRNWPSPIVFHDQHSYDNPEPRETPLTLPVDCENIEIINAEEYRVFNNPLYEGYAAYRSKMPAFHELHKVRKGAGQSSVDADTPQDSLAFQGSMRIKKNGAILQEIQGSGHHGPDYVGVASVRAGKGQKVQSQAPATYRMV